MINTILWLLLGFVLGAMFILYVRYQKRAEQQVFALGLILAALVYIGFALVFGAEPVWLLIEAGGVALFSLFAWLGWQGSPYWIAVGWLLHPLWDGGLHLLGSGHAFAPEWYVLACISFDLIVAVYMAFHFRNASLKVRGT